jgi:quercetin dioxygenase-like cupin family protein
MPTLINSPKIIQAVGAIPEWIEEYVGRVNTGTEQVSVARIIAPKGWQEPEQRPAFQEISVVLSGCLKVEHEKGAIDVRTGQAIMEYAGEWVRHSSPYEEGVDYVAICLPAFSPENVNRDKL